MVLMANDASLVVPLLRSGCRLVCGLPFAAVLFLTLIFIRKDGEDFQPGTVVQVDSCRLRWVVKMPVRRHQPHYSGTSAGRGRQVEVFH